MTSLARLRRTLDLAGDLSSIVGTMKTLAAVNVRQFEGAARAIDQYVETVELALQVTLREFEPDPSVQRTARNTWIAIGSDQGLCGAFNERIGHALETAHLEDDARLIVVGHRIGRRLEASGLTPVQEFRTPGSPAGVTDLVSELLVMVGEDELGALTVVYNRPRPEGGFETVVVPLLPIDDAWLDQLRDRGWESRSQPGQPHEPERLFRWLIREWLFARLYLACSMSLVAENSARLLATHAAERSLEDRLHLLRMRYRNERQQAITEELLDLHR